MTTEEIVAEASQALVECLRELVEQNGFAPPLQVATVGANGNASITSFKGESGVLDARYRFADEGIMTLPLNMMVVDSRGEAARLLISVSGERRLLH